MQKKEIIEISITGILIVVLFWATVDAVKNIKKKTMRARARPAQAKLRRDRPFEERFSHVKVSSKEPKARESGLFGRLEEETMDLEPERDPFSAAPITSAESFLADVKLTGIAWDAEAPRAIINGIIVETGDTIEGVTVVEIRPNEVILSDGTRDLELMLGEDEAFDSIGSVQ